MPERPSIRELIVVTPSCTLGVSMPAWSAFHTRSVLVHQDAFCVRCPCSRELLLDQGRRCGLSWTRAIREQRPHPALLSPPPPQAGLIRCGIDLHEARSPRETPAPRAEKAPSQLSVHTPRNRHRVKCLHRSEGHREKSAHSSGSPRANHRQPVPCPARPPAATRRRRSGLLEGRTTSNSSGDQHEGAYQPTNLAALEARKVVEEPARAAFLRPGDA